MRRLYIYGNNDRIQKFNNTGAYITSWGGTGAGTGQFSTPWSVTLDASGNVYVADTGNHRVQKFNSTGTFLTSWGTSGAGQGQFSSPRGLVADASGNVYVVDSGNNRVQTFALPPAAPTSFAVATLSSTSIQWTWGDNATDESGYRVRRDSSTNTSGDLAAGTTVWMETGLTPNTSYSRYVEAFKGIAASSSTVVSTYTLAAVPVDLTLTLLSSTTLTADWGGNGNGAGTLYKIAISSDSGFGMAFTTVTLLTADTTSYTATGLSGGTAIYVRVKAQNAGGTGASASAAASTVMPAQPGQPGSFAGATVSSTSIQWSWASSQYVTEYRLYTSTGGYIAAVSSSALNYAETGLSPNVQYTRYVRAWNVSYQNDSAQGSAYTNAAVPVTLAVVAVSSTSLAASWATNGNAAGTRYEIGVSSDSGFGLAFTTTTLLTADTTGYTATGLPGGTAIYVRVRAQNASGTGYSAYVQTDILTPAQPSKPATFAGATASATSIQWSWGASTFVTEYRIYTSTDGYIAAVSSSTLNYTETGLTPNTQYTRYVRAWNVAYQNDSDPASAYTAAAVPASLTLTVQSRTRLTAAWGANSNPTGTKYQVDYSTNAGFAGFSYSTTTAVSIGIGGLTPGETYYARAKAFNANSVPTSTATASVAQWALPVITAITPSSATNIATAGITVTGTGTGLRAGDVARLEKSGAVYQTTSTIVNATSFLAAFSVFGVDPGVWNVILEDAEGNESALSSYTQFTVSTGTTGNGIAINSLTSTGSVTTTGGLTVSVSSGITELSGGYIYLSTDPINTPLRVSSGAVAGAGINPGNTFIPNTAIEVVVYNASQLVTSFSSATVEISITYPDSNPSDGIVDGTNVQETNLYMVWLDTVTGDWSRIPSTVDTVNNKVLASVHHLSVFGVAGLSTMPDLSTAKVYPNPWKPGSGGNHDRAKLKFDNLADNTSVKIYNLVGELVDSLAASSVGFLEWDGKTDGGEKATSGVYFAYVKAGSGQKVLKFAIER